MRVSSSGSCRRASHGIAFHHSLGPPLSCCLLDSLPLTCSVSHCEGRLRLLTGEIGPELTVDETTRPTEEEATFPCVLANVSTETGQKDAFGRPRSKVASNWRDDKLICSLDGNSFFSREKKLGLIHAVPARYTYNRHIVPHHPLESGALLFHDEAYSIQAARIINASRVTSSSLVTAV